MQEIGGYVDTVDFYSRPFERKIFLRSCNDSGKRKHTQVSRSPGIVPSEFASALRGSLIIHPCTDNELTRIVRASCSHALVGCNKAAGRIAPNDGNVYVRPIRRTAFVGTNANGVAGPKAEPQDVASHALRLLRPCTLCHVSKCPGSGVWCGGSNLHSVHREQCAAPLPPRGYGTDTRSAPAA
jgi:hypothetical protein